MFREDLGKWLSWVAFTAGIWLIISPRALAYTNTIPANNDITVGVVVAILALVTAVWSKQTASLLSWVISIAGIWEISAPFLLNYSGASIPMANAVILGLAITALGIWRAFSTVTQRSTYSTAYFSQETRKKRKDRKEDDFPYP